MENEEQSEAAAIDSLKGLISDDSYNLGQADDVKPVANPEPLIKDVPLEAKEPEPVKAETSEPEDFEIEVEGEKYKVPAKLKDKFMMQADYTKKTMELAEKSKALVDPKEVESYKQQIAHYQSLALQSIDTNEAKLAEVNKELLAADVNADPIRVLQLAQEKTKLESKINEGRAIKGRLDQENAERQSQSLNQEWEQLLAKQPEWKDEAVRKADRGKIESFLTKNGYTKEDVASIGDHRALLIAYKAARFDELTNAKTEVIKRIEKLPPKIERPGVPSGAEGQGAKSAYDSLRKSGSVDDAAAALRGLM